MLDSSDILVACMNEGQEFLLNDEDDIEDMRLVVLPDFIRIRKSLYIQPLKSPLHLAPAGPPLTEAGLFGRAPRVEALVPMEAESNLGVMVCVNKEDNSDIERMNQEDDLGTAFVPAGDGRQSDNDGPSYL